MTFLDADIESGEEEDGFKSQKEQEEELKKAKKKQVNLLLWVDGNFIINTKGCSQKNNLSAYFPQSVDVIRERISKRNNLSKILKKGAADRPSARQL